MSKRTNAATERRTLAALVLESFERAWPNQPKYPDQDICNTIAASLRPLQVLACGLGRPNELGDAGKYAGLFLRHLPDARGRITSGAATLERMTLKIRAGVMAFAAGVVGAEEYDPLAEDRARLAALLAALDTAQVAVAALMAVQRPERQQFDAESVIGALARAAWRKAGCEVSLSIKVERDNASGSLIASPLVHFVHEIMLRLGEGSSLATVAEALRGRRKRERPRGGGRKK